MTPPQLNYPTQQDQNHQQQNAPQPQHGQMMPFLPSPQGSSLPTTPIPLYPTGAAAIIPAPPTYELIPNRIFVGGFPTTTTETDLREHFEKFYAVKDVKMVKSLDGVSKGYGFITFETEDQAEAIRQLTPKQLEFRNRKLNLGPAIRKINASAFPPSYAIAAPSQLVSASPSPFGYAISASPSPYGGFSISAAPQMFVYPPVANQDTNSTPTEQQTTPKSSPTHQQPQIFFAGDQEPARTYASAVTGPEKADAASDEQPQPLATNNNVLNTQYHRPQWNEQHQVDPNNNNNSGYYHHPQQYQQQQQFQQQTNDKAGCVPMQLYMPNQGMYPQSYYVPQSVPNSQYPPLMQPQYWQQHPQQKSPYVGYNYYNNWMGPSGEMHPQQHPQNPYFFPQYPQQMHGDENSFSRPLQAPRAGKKSRKPSESQEKKNKSPTKGVKGTPTNSPSSDAQQKSQKWTGATVSPLSSSLQSLAISSPTKN